jgi:hypothetical protein
MMISVLLITQKEETFASNYWDEKYLAYLAKFLKGIWVLPALVQGLFSRFAKGFSHSL